MSGAGARPRLGGLVLPPPPSPGDTRPGRARPDPPSGGAWVKGSSVLRRRPGPWRFPPPPPGVCSRRRTGPHAGSAAPKTPVGEGCQSHGLCNCVTRGGLSSPGRWWWAEPRLQAPSGLGGAGCL